MSPVTSDLHYLICVLHNHFAIYNCTRRHWTKCCLLHIHPTHSLSLFYPVVEDIWVQRCIILTSCCWHPWSWNSITIMSHSSKLDLVTHPFPCTHRTLLYHWSVSPYYSCFLFWCFKRKLFHSHAAETTTLTWSSLAAPMDSGPWAKYQQVRTNKDGEQERRCPGFTAQIRDRHSARLRHSHTHLWLCPILRFLRTELFVQTKWSPSSSNEVILNRAKQLNKADLFLYANWQVLEFSNRIF